MQTEHPSAFGKMPVVADVNTDLADRRVEHRIAHVPRPEVKLLPEAVHVRNVRLAVLAEVFPVSVDDRGGVVADPDLVLPVHRDDQADPTRPRWLMRHPR